MTRIFELDGRPFPLEDVHQIYCPLQFFFSPDSRGWLGEFLTGASPSKWCAIILELWKIYKTYLTGIEADLKGYNFIKPFLCCLLLCRHHNILYLIRSCFRLKSCFNSKSWLSRADSWQQCISCNFHLFHLPLLSCLSLVVVFMLALWRAFSGEHFLFIIIRSVSNSASFTPAFVSRFHTFF